MQREVISQWRAVYDDSSRADSWLEAHRWTYGPQVAQATIADVRTKLNLTPGDRVLEVGTGSGAFLMGVLHPDQNGIGFDLCESLVQESGRLGVDRNRVRLGVAEGLRLPIRSESFDKVLCYSVAHHFPGSDYTRGVLRELVRVCRVGGVVLLGDVSGVLERHRKALIKRGVPQIVADGILAPLIPIRYLRWLRARANQSRWPSTYRRSFFSRSLRDLNCQHEILDQEIPGRSESLGRFDVRIWKKAALKRAAAPLGAAFWTLGEFAQGILFEVGILLHG